MEHTFKLDKSKYYKALLITYNAVGKMGLSKLEIDILSTMLEHGLKTVNTDTREILRKQLDKGKYVINNYIIGLKEKSILIEQSEGKSLVINPNIVNSIKDNEVSFKFELV